ncbi:MAG: hypothetical protein AAGC68_07900, partial [Verrucomicrobiota bacterium]
MNPEEFSRNDLITDLSPVVSGLGCLFVFILWLASLAGRKRFPAPGLGWNAIGILLVGFGIWLASQFAGQFLALATSWPLWVTSLLGGFAAETILFLYQFEKSLVAPARGKLLLALRLSALAVLLLILIQPVRSFLESKEIEREVAVLIDESDSMLLAQERLDPTERLDRAALFDSNSVAGRPPFASVLKRASSIQETLLYEISALESAPTPQAGLETRSPSLPQVFEKLSGENGDLISTLASLRELSSLGPVRGEIDSFLKRSRDGLVRILALSEEAASKGDAAELLRQLKIAEEEVTGIVDSAGSVGRKADEGFFQSLSASRQEQINSLAEVPRIEVARQSLEFAPRTETEGEASRSLSEQLKENYNLRFFRFAREVERLPDLASLEKEPGIGTDPARSQTDFGEALDYVLENTAAESLAGVLVLSDGRHNGGVLPEDALRQLAVQNTPLSTVPIGGRVGPVDISILNVKAPESIYLDDRVVVSADAKMDGVHGKTVVAELLCNSAIVETLEIEVSDVNYRTELRFVHRPDEKGIHDYRIRLESEEEEMFPDNNEWDFKVAVTDDRTNVLLVDSYPRWEFRYLRNLFYGRDKSVHLQ